MFCRGEADFRALAQRALVCFLIINSMLKIWKFAEMSLSLQQKSINSYCMSKKEKEEKIKEFWEYYESTQGSITIADPIVLD